MDFLKGDNYNFEMDNTHLEEMFNEQKSSTIIVANLVKLLQNASYSLLNQHNPLQ
jgi:hypothetical protein